MTKMACEIISVLAKAEGGCEPSAKNPQSEPPLVKVGPGGDYTRELHPEDIT